jgi:choline dehydrogenase-like flavoprotein
MSATVSGALIPFLAPAAIVVSAVGVAFLLAIPHIQYELDDPIGVNQYEPIDDLLLYYDYIVVGGGSAGAVIASRLSEDPTVDVLLVESGSDGTYVSDVPGLLGLLPGTTVDWAYRTNPDGKSCLGMRNQQCIWHRGHALGGSSIMNGMLYVRGNRADFDEWARLGNYGWSYDEVLPYFKKSQNQLNPYLAKDHVHHATGGPLPTVEAPYRTPLADAFQDAAAELGYRSRIDINGENQFGFQFMQVCNE